MFLYQIVLSVIAVIYAIAVFIFLFKYKNIIKSLLLSGFLGIALLAVLKLLETIIGIKIYINLITVISSFLLGPCAILFFFIIDYLII